MLRQLVGLGCFGLGLYYAWFFSLRPEPGTLLQIVVLGCAGALLVRGQGARPTRWRIVVAAGLVLSVFVLMDRDSHSVSDTLNRAVPSAALLVAVTFTPGYRRGPRRTI